MLCSWLEGHPQDFAELEPGLREALLLQLRWALGDGSGPEKSLCAAVSRTAPVAREGPEEGVADSGDPDPHYILGLQAEDVAAHLTWQDAVSGGGRRGGGLSSPGRLQEQREELSCFASVACAEQLTDCRDGRKGPVCGPPAAERCLLGVGSGGWRGRVCKGLPCAASEGEAGEQRWAGVGLRGA